MNKVKDARYKDITARSILYAVLVIVALYYLAPLFLMILTSFRSMDEIRVGQLIEWPKSFSFDAWHAAWNQVQIGARDELGLQPYFMNSIRMVIPSVLLSTLFGAL
ncbi:MAG: carbohydrate ABC transporter permease, partial [Reinekea forsetii]|nr:carbohydrate ABC transporter permease [Reinekea forsetii]